ncbi:MAG TPA: hypothetical protein PK674_03755 [Candidatus Absconditabacterales bacterium]|nr:hypothetical protein [Candidatus Absconditabacterales bacterium]HOQ79261.1 hypothetical protein [Candidatus Absconditabacterales bacterium]
MTKSQKKIKGGGEQTFRLLVILLILSVLGLVFLKVSVFLLQKQINENRESLQQQEQQLTAYESATSYDKFLLVNDLEERITEMPWFEHIPKILQILQDIKNLDPNSDDVITLSDFNVSLDEITLKGRVSTLKALYYNSPTSGGFKALLERFQELDFIKDITIRSYNRASDRNFEFILNAKVIDNDGK